MYDAVFWGKEKFNVINKIKNERTKFCMNVMRFDIYQPDTVCVLQ